MRCRRQLFGGMVVAFVILTSVGKADEAPRGGRPGEKAPAAAPIRVAVYKGEGASEKSRNKLVKVLEGQPGFSVQAVTVDEIRAGKLSEFDVVIHPGGSGGGQGRALGEEGRAAERKFLEEGGGYIGVCAGAYLASIHYEWSLGVLDAKVVDSKHWARGFGEVQLGMGGRAKEILGVSEARSPIYYHQGPLLAPGGDPDVPDYEELAKFDTEIAKNGAPPGVMTGCTAIAMGPYRGGRVLCFSPHPEHTEPTELMLVKAVQWAAAGRKPH